MMEPEAHRLERAGWLRAAVLGANDGLVSTASLVVGVAAANPAPGAVLLAGIAGLTAGALSMAAGEFVSVSSQADLEAAEVARETAELAATPGPELAELAGIYRARGLSPELAREVAAQLTKHDALGAHLRDELGITEISAARPLQAALASAASFALGGSSADPPGPAGAPRDGAGRGGRCHGAGPGVAGHAGGLGGRGAHPAQRRPGDALGPDRDGGHGGRGRAGRPRHLTGRRVAIRDLIRAAASAH